MKNSIIKLTKDGFEALKRELRKLKNIKLPTIRARMDEARKDGDLSENTPWVMAQEENETVRSRIDEIEHVVKNSVVVKKDSCGSIDVGCKVKLRWGKEEKEYTIVSHEEANPLENKVSLESPIGKALMGRKAKDTIEIQTPSGKKKVTIVKVN